MGITPFGKGAGKTAKYHGASGPNSAGRMSKNLKAKANVKHENGGTNHVIAETEDVYNSRIKAVDSVPNATQKP